MRKPYWAISTKHSVHSTSLSTDPERAQPFDSSRLRRDSLRASAEPVEARSESWFDSLRSLTTMLSERERVEASKGQH